MAVLQGLKPEAVWTFFEELCAIPHGSGNCQAISDHLVRFAKDRDLEVHQDAMCNVIIKKPASAGYEDHAPVILQGHMDMVAVASPGSGIDMTTAPLSLQTDGEWVSARDTSLGGDDGIAVAMCLAILDAKDIPHPPLEVVITTEEETGMDGARELDASLLSARRFINLDNEEEGVLLAGCAGGGRFHAYLSFTEEPCDGDTWTLSVSGLKGGHSGVCIHEERGNANVLLARVLYAVYGECEGALRIADITGGDADNAIAATAAATFVCTDKDKLQAVLDRVQAQIREELAQKDAGLCFTLVKEEAGAKRALTAEDSLRVLSLILALPNGIIAMSGAVKGLVETSLNLGMVRTDKNTGIVMLSYAVRSSLDSAKYHLVERLSLIAKSFGARYELVAPYPGWQYAVDSPLRDTMCAVYEKMYGKQPVIEAIHAGVECGFFAEKIPGLDCISLGPDMSGIHSVEERLSVSSTARTFAYVCAVLKEL